MLVYQLIEDFYLSFQDLLHQINTSKNSRPTWMSRWKLGSVGYFTPIYPIYKQVK